MLKLEQITPNTALVGIELGQIVRVVATEPVGPDALTVVYKTADGRFRERMEPLAKVALREGFFAAGGKGGGGGRPFLA